MANDDRAIWTVDCETDPFKYGRIPQPFIWGAYNIDSGAYHEFDTTDAFITWARSGKKLCYAHNGGKFDYHYCLRYIASFAKLKVINGRLAKFKIGDCEFRDSWNILPLPLSAYKKVEFDYRKMERDVRDMHMDEIRHYLKMDCEYLADLVREFVDRHGTPLTLASAAMKWFEAQRDKPADKTNESFYDKFAPFYAGGRVQCFKTGVIKKSFKSFDIRSAYPEAMTHLHPAGDVYTIYDGVAEDDETLSRSFIRLECESHGAFHFRAPDGSLAFPSDGKRRSFHVTGWEYLAARDTGTLVQPVIQAVYEFADAVTFTDYVSHWFAEKASAVKGTPRAIIAKFFLNSLYGKFGANPANYRDYEVLPSEWLWPALEDDWQLENIVDDNVFVSRPIGDFARRYYNVATAAAITGYVRAKLWRAIRGARGVIYCDTDCIVAHDAGSLDVHPTRLGAWECEGEYSEGYVARPKLYAFKRTKPEKGSWWKTAAKGVKLTPEEIREVALGNEHIVSINDAPTFRMNGNVLYLGEMVGYVERDDPRKMFQRRKVRMAR